MKKVLATMAIVATLLLTGCGNSGQTAQQAPKAPVSIPEAPKVLGNPEVYKRISKLTDCDALQKEFNTTEANSKVNRNNGKLDQAQINIEYMTAAYNRQQELKCFGGN